LQDLARVIAQRQSVQLLAGADASGENFPLY
jgi:hypothetical protein